MKYVGSKNRLSKYLAPIIQKYIDDNNIKQYLEPFVGGANMIDKIKCDKKIGLDSHKELIALLKYVQDTNNELPDTITEEEYNNVKDNRDKYPDWYVGLVGFASTFGAKYFGGYARGYKSDGVTPRDMPNEGIRNIRRQRKDLKDIHFGCMNFLDIPEGKLKNYVIYCDIPYRNTTKYKTEEFPYNEFYAWCRRLSKNNIVLISEYNMPNDFKCIWSKNHKTSLDTNEHKKRVEKLFIIK